MGWGGSNGGEEDEIPVIDAATSFDDGEGGMEAQGKGRGGEGGGVLGGTTGGFDATSKFWHRFDPVLREREKTATDARQKKVIERYFQDYPLSPPEEHAWVSDPTMKVLRRFAGKGETPAKYLDCMYRVLLDEIDVERWRLLGREVRIIDHDASQQRRRLRKLQGRDVIQTDQGFNLTEDQFYLREDWPPPDPQILKDYEEFEKMPSVEEIANALRAEGEFSEERLNQELFASPASQSG